MKSFHWRGVVEERDNFIWCNSLFFLQTVLFYDIITFFMTKDFINIAFMVGVGYNGENVDCIKMEVFNE